MIVFISDLHLGDQFIQSDLLSQFLQKIREGKHQLVIVGDIFDFWRDPKIKDFQGLFDGIEVSFLLGNHDHLLEFINLQSRVIGKKACMDRGGKLIVAVHGEEFDTTYSFPGAFARCMDRIIYWLSTKIGYNLRRLIRRYSDWFYGYDGFLQKVEKAYHPNFNIAIVGHSHIGGECDVNGFQIFNLGSWYQAPHAFFLREDDKYAFINITSTVLLPAEKDYRDLGGYQGVPISSLGAI